MSLVLSLLAGTGVAVSLVVVAALLLARASADLPRFEKRKTSHVTEVLQVRPTHPYLENNAYLPNFFFLFLFYALNFFFAH